MTTPQPQGLDGEIRELVKIIEGANVAFKIGRITEDEKNRLITFKLREAFGAMTNLIAQKEAEKRALYEEMVAGVKDLIRNRDELFTCSDECIDKALELPLHTFKAIAEKNGITSNKQ